MPIIVQHGSLKDLKMSDSWSWLYHRYYFAAPLKETEHFERWNNTFKLLETEFYYKSNINPVWVWTGAASILEPRFPIWTNSLSEKKLRFMLVCEVLGKNWNLDILVYTFPEVQIHWLISFRDSILSLCICWLPVALFSRCPALLFHLVHDGKFVSTKMFW